MRPYVPQINTFDVKDGTSIQFEYGGDVSYASQLNIYLSNDFSKPIFSNRVVNMSCINSIPPNVSGMKNGVQYAAEILSYHTATFEESSVSEPSNKSYFWCYSNPVFEFTNVYDGIIINNQSFQAELKYEQAEGIGISKAKYEIYDAQMLLIGGSDFWSDYDENRTFNYNGLENNGIYYIRAWGETVKGQILDTGYISIFIQFEKPNNYSVLYADADNGNGVIEYYTNIKLIEPTRDRETYKYDSGFIDLEDDRIIYDKNILINGDFIMAVRHRYTIGEIATFSNSIKGITLSVIKCSDGMCRYKLLVPNELCNYTIYSEPFIFDETRLATCWIKRINNLYELFVFSEKDDPDEYNLFLGQIRPINNTMRYDVWIDTDNSPTIRIEKDNVVIWKKSEEPNEEDLNVNDIWIDVDLEE